MVEEAKAMTQMIDTSGSASMSFSSSHASRPMMTGSRYDDIDFDAEDEEDNE